MDTLKQHENIKNRSKRDRFNNFDLNDHTIPYPKKCSSLNTSLCSLYLSRNLVYTINFQKKNSTTLFPTNLLPQQQAHPDKLWFSVSDRTGPTPPLNQASVRSDGDAFGICFALCAFRRERVRERERGLRGRGKRRETRYGITHHPHRSSQSMQFSFCFHK